MQLMISRRQTKNQLLEAKIAELRETMAPFKDTVEYQEKTQK